MPIIRNLIQFEKHKKCETVQFLQDSETQTSHMSLLIFMKLATWNTVIVVKSTKASPIPAGAFWQLYINTND